MDEIKFMEKLLEHMVLVNQNGHTVRHDSEFEYFFDPNYEMEEETLSGRLYRDGVPVTEDEVKRTIRSIIGRDPSRVLNDGTWMWDDPRITTFENYVEITQSL